MGKVGIGVGVWIWLGMCLGYVFTRVKGFITEGLFDRVGQKGRKLLRIIRPAMSGTLPRFWEQTTIL